MKYWQTSRRQISLERPIVMGILNVTPDSFSDGGRFIEVDAALFQAERMVGDGADVIDVGGESTRPGSLRIEVDEEIRRVVPVIEAIAKRSNTPVSVDTSKSAVAQAAVAAGAEIINDISGLRFDPAIIGIAAKTTAGLVLMHSFGTFETMHSEPPVENIVSSVGTDLARSIALARNGGVLDEQIVVDIGLGFGKTLQQNLELIAKLDNIVDEFGEFPVMVGASRKSFLARVGSDVPPDERLAGGLAVAAIAIWNGAAIIRTHDVRETVQAVRAVAALREQI